MIDVVHPKCVGENCNKRPSHNYQNKLIPLYCSECKLKDMIVVTHKKCIYKGCTKICIYNYENEKKPIYCFDHKIDGMINLYKNYCIYANCTLSSSCNFDGLQPKYCGEHKLEGMIAISKNRCIFEGCNTISNFNYKDKKFGIYCSEHKLPDMIDLVNKFCIYPNCTIQPTFNIKGETKALYCVQHKLDGMVGVKYKYCVNDWCETISGNDKYNGHCLKCFVHTFPDKPVTRNYKTKEQSVVDFIKYNFNNLTWICDKKIQNGCSKRRPELLLDLGYQVLIIEIDENQHEDYDNSCENKRLMEISQDLNFRPIIFIRFNPDGYVKNKANVQSCWSTNTKGLCVIKKNKQQEWNDRLNTLKIKVSYWLNSKNKSNKTIHIEKLFYDK